MSSSSSGFTAQATGSQSRTLTLHTSNSLALTLSPRRVHSRARPNNNHNPHRNCYSLAFVGRHKLGYPRRKLGHHRANPSTTSHVRGPRRVQCHHAIPGCRNGSDRVCLLSSESSATHSGRHTRSPTAVFSGLGSRAGGRRAPLPDLPGISALQRAAAPRRGSSRSRELPPMLKTLCARKMKTR